MNESETLEALESQFVSALAAVRSGKLDQAEDMLRAIIKVEPRLPEPHMELARLLLDTERLGPAEDHAREAVNHLASAGAWTEDLAEDVVKSIAHATLAEVLRRRADEDDVIFGDPETFKALVAEARTHFETASRLDPSDSTSSYHAFFLGEDGHKAPM